jgi:hypothetical protein
LHIDYEISEQDHAAAQRLAIKKSRPFYGRLLLFGMPAFGLVLLLFIIPAAFKRGFSTNLLPGLVVPLLALSYPLLIRRNIHKVYASSANLRGPRSLDADDAGLRFRGTTFSSQVSWPHFSRFFDDKDSFVLFQSPRVFNIIPKRQLSPEQIAGLRELFTRHINRST